VAAEIELLGAAPRLGGDGFVVGLAHRRLGGLGLGLLFRWQLRLYGRRPRDLCPRYRADAWLLNVLL
jgi:hypothetical protein